MNDNPRPPRPNNIKINDLAEKAWLESPTEIFRSMKIMPTPEMTEAQRINALSRLIILIALALFFIRIGSWWIFLILGLILILVLFFFSKRNQGQELIIQNFHCAKKRPNRKPPSEPKKPYKNFVPY